MHELLTVGSIVLAIVNVGVMWAMAHQWRYAWHSNLGLQLLWLPYDYLTSQYGLLGLGVIITFVSLKGAFRENQLARAAERGQPSHRRHRHRVGPHPAAGSPSATGPQPVLSPEPAAVPEVDAATAGLPGPEVASEPAGVGSHPGLPVPAGIAIPADTSDLVDRADLAGVSVSSGPAAAADGDGDDPAQRPPVPRIPQQPDRRTAFDAERRPHFQ